MQCPWNCSSSVLVDQNSRQSPTQSNIMAMILLFLWAQTPLIMCPLTLLVLGAAAAPSTGAPSVSSRRDDAQPVRAGYDPGGYRLGVPRQHDEEVFTPDLTQLHSLTGDWCWQALKRQQKALLGSRYPLLDWDSFWSLSESRCCANTDAVLNKMPFQIAKELSHRKKKLLVKNLRHAAGDHQTYDNVRQQAAHRSFAGTFGRDWWVTRRFNDTALIIRRTWGNGLQQEGPGPWLAGRGRNPLDILREVEAGELTVDAAGRSIVAAGGEAGEQAAPGGVSSAERSVGRAETDRSAEDTPEEVDESGGAGAAGAGKNKDYIGPILGTGPDSRSPVPKIEPGSALHYELDPISAEFESLKHEIAAE